MAQVAEKVFKHFLQTPDNVRKMFIDEMQADDRCRLTRCSKKCNKEAKASKNYINELYFSCYEGQAKIDVIHEKNDIFGRWHGFKLEFVNISGTNFKICSNSRGQELWRVGLGTSANICELAKKEFAARLKSNQKIVKRLRIDSPKFDCKDIHENVETFKRLEDLTIHGQVDVRRILSKTRKPLKSLTTDVIKGIVNCKKVYQVQQSLELSEARLNIQQLFRLSAKQIAIDIGKLSERDVHKFIRCWQDGTIRREFEKVEIFTCGSNFNHQKFLKLLRIYDREYEDIEIKHYRDPGRSALLSVDFLFVSFEMCFSENGLE